MHKSAIRSEIDTKRLGRDNCGHDPGGVHGSEGEALAGQERGSRVKGPREEMHLKGTM